MELIMDVNDIKLKTKIADIENDKIFVQYPSNMETTRTVFLPNETSLQVSFIKNQETYSFSTKVVGRTRKNISFIALRMPELSKIHRIQRREFVRVNTLLDVAFEIDGMRFTTVTKNLSAGGFAAVLPNQVDLQKGTQGKIYIVLPMRSGDIHYLMLQSEVTRTYEENHTRYVSLKFINMGQVVQQQIIRFCFEKQLEHRT